VRRSDLPSTSSPHHSRAPSPLPHSDSTFRPPLKSDPVRIPPEKRPPLVSRRPRRLNGANQEKVAGYFVFFLRRNRRQLPKSYRDSASSRSFLLGFFLFFSLSLSLSFPPNVSNFSDGRGNREQRDLACPYRGCQAVSLQFHPRVDVGRSPSFAPLARHFPMSGLRSRVVTSSCRRVTIV